MLPLMIVAEEASDGLAKMEEKGKKTLLVYSGGVSEYYNYSGQIFDSIPEAKKYSGVSECYLPESDHTYMLKRDRLKLIGAVRDWYKQNWSKVA